VPSQFDPVTQLVRTRFHTVCQRVRAPYSNCKLADSTARCRRLPHPQWRSKRPICPVLSASLLQITCKTRNTVCDEVGEGCSGGRTKDWRRTPSTPKGRLFKPNIKS
jgi:hypothetical protein